MSSCVIIVARVNGETFSTMMRFVATSAKASVRVATGTGIVTAVAFVASVSGVYVAGRTAAKSVIGTAAAVIGTAAATERAEASGESAASVTSDETSVSARITGADAAGLTRRAAVTVSGATAASAAARVTRTVSFFFG